MKKPTITLSKIKFSEFASHETNCYEAVVVVDGKPFCHAHNGGFGGGDDFSPISPNTYEDIKKLDNFIRENYEPQDLADIGAPGETLPQTLESVCCDLLNAHIAEKKIKRIIKTKVLFKAPDGELYTQSRKNTPPSVLIPGVLAKTPGAIILNTLPLDRAVAIYRGIG